MLRQRGCDHTRQAAGHPETDSEADPDPDPDTPSTGRDGTVAVGWLHTATWTTGSQSSVSVTNRTALRLAPWRIRFTTADTVATIWDASASPTTGGFIASAPSYATTLDAGAATSFGLTSTTTGGAAVVPTGCTVLDLPAGTDVACTVSGAPAGPPASSTPAPTPIAVPAPLTQPAPVGP